MVTKTMKIIALCLLAASSQLLFATHIPSSQHCEIGASVPSGFAGHDIAEIVKKIQTLDLEKDQYETEDSYQSRVRTVVSSHTSMLTFDDLCFVVATKEKHPTVEFTYDADNSKMTVNLLTYTAETDYSKNPVQVKSLAKDRISAIEKSTRHYVGENLFGVKADVTYTDVDWYNIVFDPIAVRTALGESLNPFAFAPNGKYVFAMTPDAARQSHKNLNLIVLAKLVPPFLKEHTHYSGATIDSPYVDRGKEYELRVGIKEYVVFDRVSGQIFARLKVN